MKDMIPEKPTEALKKLIFGWPFISGLFLCVGGALWGKFGDTPFGLVLLLIGLCFGFFLVAHKIFKRDWFRYGVPTALSVLIVVGTVLVVKNASKVPTPTTAQSQPPVAPQTIAGTHITHDVISEIFPYGYGLLFVSDAQPTRHKVFIGTNNLIKWDVDWEKIEITRDVAAGAMKLNVPAKIDTPEGAKGGQLFISGPSGGYTQLVFGSKLKTGWMALSPIYMRNKPALCVLTLSDNQRTPIFAIGFRIVTDEEITPPKKPK